MRVGIFIEPWIRQNAGIGVFTRELAKAASVGNFEYVQIGSEQRIEGMEFIRIPSWKSSFFNPFRYFNLLQLDLETHGIDILIDPSHYSSLGMIRGREKVVILHDLTPLLLPNYHRFNSVLAHRLLLKQALKSASLIVTISNQTKDDVSRILGITQDVVRIYPGIQFQPIDGTELTGQQRDDFIIAVSTIEPRKNHFNLIRAFEAFCINNSTTRLRIVGAHGWKVDLKRIIKESNVSDRIEYLGYVDQKNLKELYRKAKFSVYASLYEGFGLPILESMSQGCPVITSNLGAMKEAAGSAALLIDPQSPSSIAEAMVRLDEDSALRSHLSMEGLDRAHMFSWTKFMENLENVLRDSAQNDRLFDVA
ncbi:MAG: glycosyltransferase family 1 protein [Flavobacteriales bacterium]